MRPLVREESRKTVRKDLEEKMIKTRLWCLAVPVFVVFSMAWLPGIFPFSMPAPNVGRGENEKPGKENMAIEQADQDSPDRQAQGLIDSSLRDAVEHFIDAADRGDIATIVSIYDPKFRCVRVADEGGFVELSREQMIAFWKNVTGKTTGSQPGAPVILTQKTTIHYAEVVGDTGFVLLTRIKNIGNGWEPMFYNLVWKKQGSNWRLLREFVHQKSIPKQSLK
jgi:hypothetical protein